MKNYVDTINCSHKIYFVPYFKLLNLATLVSGSVPKLDFLYSKFRSTIKFHVYIQPVCKNIRNLMKIPKNEL